MVVDFELHVRMYIYLCRTFWYLNSIYLALMVCSYWRSQFAEVNLGAYIMHHILMCTKNKKSGVAVEAATSKARIRCSNTRIQQMSTKKYLCQILSHECTARVQCYMLFVMCFFFNSSFRSVLF